MTEIIEAVEGEVRDLVAVPQQTIVATAAAGPDGMVDVASKLATVLARIVERQRLYAVISGKKYPQVEAWMTIGRLDNVVAREPRAPIRHDDGSYEAFAELIRLSDGMIVGSSSALCGTPDDKPWASRSEPARRSMAQTRATSRAFRQQYSWIMALAGYEATPAEEMPHDLPRTAQEPRNVTPTPTGPAEWLGTVEVGKAPADYELRQTPDGQALAFRLKVGRSTRKVIATGDLAGALAAIRDSIVGQPVTCWGTLSQERWTPPDTTREIVFDVMALERIQTPDVTLPAPSTRPATDAAVGEPAEPTAEPSAPPASDDALWRELDEAGL